MPIDQEAMRHQTYNQYTVRLPMLVSVVFSIPISLLLWFFLNTKNAQIAFSQKEIKGLEYLHPLGQMTFQSFHLLLAPLDANHSDLAASLGAFKKADADLMTQVGTDHQSLFVRGREHLTPENLTSLLEPAAAEPNPKALLQAIVQMLALIQHVGDTSNLILDPDLDTYYLMDLTVLSIPKFMSYLLNTGIVGEATPSTAWSNKSGFAALINYDIMPALRTKTASALQEDPNFYGINPSLAPRLTGALQGLMEKLLELNSGILTNQDPAKLHLLLVDTMTRLQAFWLVSHAELTALLDIRIQSLKNFRLMATLAAIMLWGASMLLTVYSVRTLKKLQALSDLSSKKFQDLYLRREMALQGALDAIISVDKSGAIIEFNPAAESIFGQPKAAVIGKSLEETIIPASHWEGHRAAFKKYFTDKRKDSISRRVKIAGKHASGREFPMELSIVATHLPDETVIFSAFIRDLSEQHRLEAETKLNQSKLVTASRLSALGEMAGGIAHEIKNPLAIIDGYLQQFSALTKRPDADTIVPKTIESMRRSVSRITKIIDGLKTFARSAESDPFEPTSPRQLIDECLELCRPRLDASGIKITVTLNSQQTLHCRAVQISQVLVNLINNAHDAIAMTQDPWIEVDVIDQESHCIIAITDSGLGIPAHIAEKMLQPFFTTKPIGKGTGLGLSISLGIIESHKGTLTLDKEHPNTRFLIKLPSVPTLIIKQAA